MKIKTSEATELQLDWLVAKCENAPVRFSPPHEQLLVVGYPYMVWQPHANWSQGGPIIDLEKITLQPVVRPDGWMARTQKCDSVWEGPTPLIAAMRCYVASEMGEEVEIPDELIGE